MSDKTPELLPCPFCGGTATTTFIRDGRQAFCRKCRAMGTPTYHGPTGIESTDARAIAAWNRRAPILPGERLPGGLVAVPVVPTKAMLVALYGCVVSAFDIELVNEFWLHLLAASKEPEG